MAILRNIPTDSPQNISSLIDTKKNQIVSKALSLSDDFQITLLSFSQNESVSEEEYFGDTMYLLVEGTANVFIDGHIHTLIKDDIFKVDAHVLHAIQSNSAFKLLQITVKE